MWCSAADTHLKLLDRAVSGACFLTGSVFARDIAHRRSVTVLCVCCIRSGGTRCTRLMVLYLDRMCQGGYTRCSGCTSVHSCIASLQNLAVSQDIYSPISVPLEQSCWPCIRWCGTLGFQEQGQCFFIGLSCSIVTIVFYYFSHSLLSVNRLVLWAGVFILIWCRLQITLSQPCTADLF